MASGVLAGPLSPVNPKTGKTANQPLLAILFLGAFWDTYSFSCLCFQSAAQFPICGRRVREGSF